MKVRQGRSGIVHKDPCAMCGEPLKDKTEEKLVSRTNNILMGILRYYSRLYYGVDDCTNMSEVTIELKSNASSSDDDEDRKEFQEYVDSDDGKEGWKEPLGKEGYRYWKMFLIFACTCFGIGATMLALDLSKAIPDKTGGGGGGGGGGGEAAPAAAKAAASFVETALPSNSGTAKEQAEKEQVVV
ncbi:unnamed protein product [Amoebophrya sp. A25]|nr:unnamed protein product [Amoebophrya sp. A25]|eukprot:GSA25T00000018001.1